MTESELSHLARNLMPLEPGIWGSPAAQKTMSFPQHGHAECYAIEDSSFWFQHRNQCIAAVVERHPPPGAIFDVGGGNGYVSLGLNQRGFETVLVEPGLEGSRFARGRGLEPVICSTVEDAGFADASLPAVGVFDVIEHIEDDVGFLNTLARLIRRGGKLYVTVPAYGWLWSDEDRVAGHHRRYRLGALVRLLARCGFASEFASYIFWPLPPAIFVSRSLPARLGRHSETTVEKYQGEHNPQSRGRGLLQWALERELARLRRGHALPFGSSCLVAARRD
jgi:SAM-dependent methyltransferase